MREVLFRRLTKFMGNLSLMFEALIFPYWLLFAVLIAGAVYSYKIKVIGTLKVFGADYEEYWSPSKQRKQLENYRRICEANNLSLFYWHYMRLYPKIAFILFLGWIGLLLLTQSG